MSSFVVYSVAFNEGEALLHAIHHTCPSTLFCDMKLDTVNGTPYVLSLSRTFDSPRSTSCSIFRIDWKEDEESVKPICTYAVSPTSNRLFLRRYSGSDHVVITHEKGFTFASFPSGSVASIVFSVSSLVTACLSLNSSLLFLLDTGGFITYTGGILRTISVAASEDSLLLGRSGSSCGIRHLLSVDDWFLLVTDSGRVATIPRMALTTQTTAPFQNDSLAPCMQLFPLDSDDQLAFLLQRGGVSGCAELLPFADLVELQPLAFEGAIDRCRLMEWKQTTIACIQSKGTISSFQLDDRTLKPMALPNLIVEGELLAIDTVGDVLIQVTRNCLQWSCDEYVTSETLEDGHVFTAASIVDGNVWLLMDSSELRRWSLHSSSMKTESLFVSNERVRYLEPLNDTAVALATATELLVIDASTMTRQTLQTPPVGLSHVKSLRHWLILLADAHCVHFFHYASESLSLLQSMATDSLVHFFHVNDGSLLLSFDKVASRSPNGKETAASFSGRGDAFTPISHPADAKEVSSTGSSVNQGYLQPSQTIVDQNDNTQTTVTRSCNNNLIAIEQTPVTQSLVNRTNHNQTPINQTCRNRSPVNQTPINQTCHYQSPVNQTPINHTCHNQSPVNQSPINQTCHNQSPVNQSPINQTHSHYLLLRPQPLQFVPFTCPHPSLSFHFRQNASITFSSSSLFRVVHKPSLFAPSNALSAPCRGVFPLSYNQAILLPESPKKPPFLATSQSLQPWTPLRSLVTAVSLGTKLLFASQKSLFLTLLEKPVEENALILNEPCRALRRLSDRLVVAIAQSSLCVVEATETLRIVASVDVFLGFICHVAEGCDRIRCNGSGWSHRRRYERRGDSLLPAGCTESVGVGACIPIAILHSTHLCD